MKARVVLHLGATFVVRADLTYDPVPVYTL
jgi:hypothetical protein